MLNSYNKLNKATRSMDRALSIFTKSIKNIDTATKILKDSLIINEKKTNEYEKKLSEIKDTKNKTLVEIEKYSTLKDKLNEFITH